MDIYYPLYDATDKTHQRLAELSELAHEKTSAYLKDNAPAQPLAALKLGNMRLAIKKHLKNELEEIDTLVKKIL